MMATSCIEATAAERVGSPASVGAGSPRACMTIATKYITTEASPSSDRFCPKVSHWSGEMLEASHGMRV